MTPLARLVADAPPWLRRRLAPLLGFSAVARLLLRGEDGAVVRLLEAGLNPNCCQRRAPGVSLLELALHEHNYRLVHFLIIHEVDVSSPRGSAQSTPLHLVITLLHENGETLSNLSCLRLLLQAGADPMAPDGAGITPFYLAMRLRLWAAMRLLAAAAPDLAPLLDPNARSMPH